MGWKQSVALLLFTVIALCFRCCLLIQGFCSPDGRSSTRRKRAREGRVGPPWLLDHHPRNDKKPNKHDLAAVSTASPLYIHHTALKTRNITLAMQFYSLFGYVPVAQFRAGPARAAWLELDSTSDPTAHCCNAARLELIEVPSYMLPQQQQLGKKPPATRAPNLMELPALLGYNHIAFDVTRQVNQLQKNNTTTTTTTTTAVSSVRATSLAGWIEALNQTSLERFGKTLRVALPPRQQMIATTVYELAFLYDADGCLVELLYEVGKTASSTVASGWEPWDGQGFKGMPEQ